MHVLSSGVRQLSLCAKRGEPLTIPFVAGLLTHAYSAVEAVTHALNGSRDISSSSNSSSSSILNAPCIRGTHHQSCGCWTAGHGIHTASRAESNATSSSGGGATVLDRRRVAAEWTASHGIHTASRAENNATSSSGGGATVFDGHTVATHWSDGCGMHAASGAVTSSSRGRGTILDRHRLAAEWAAGHGIHTGNNVTTSSGGGATVLDGRRVAAEWTAELTCEVAQVTRVLGRPPGLGVLLVGRRPDSLLYVTKKQEACSKVGIAAHIIQLPADTTQATLEEAVSQLGANPDIDGVLVQLPLPKHLDEEAAMDRLDPRKDVDGFHPLNMGRILMRGRSGRFVPCTPLGCLELLERSGIQVQGKTAVMLGDSNIVGTPLASLLRDRGAAAVTVCHRMSYHELFEADDWVMTKRSAAEACLPQLPGPGLKRRALQTGSKYGTDHINHRAARTQGTQKKGDMGAAEKEAVEQLQPSFNAHQLPEITRTADILVVAVGHPELVRAHWVKPGAVVLDVGINVVPNQAAPAPNISNPSHSAMTQPAHHTRGGASSLSSSVAAPSRDASSAVSNIQASSSDCFGVESASSSSSSPSSRTELSGMSSQDQCPPMQILGDVAFDEVSQVASAISPVPGGVGPMTIAAVLHNTLQAASYRAGLETW